MYLIVDGQRIPPQLFSEMRVPTRQTSLGLHLLVRRIGMGLPLGPLSLTGGGDGSEYLVTVGNSDVDYGFGCVVVGGIFVHVGVAVGMCNCLYWCLSSVKLCCREPA